MSDVTATRGTTNRNDRGSSYARRARRKWLVENYASNIPGLCRCYRCGGLLYNPDGDWLIVADERGFECVYYDGLPFVVRPLTVDRIIPGCEGGTYRRNNIRPACGGCNSETGGALGAARRIR